jgi:type II secretory pathway component GspD/PulD (secretin)
MELKDADLGFVLKSFGKILGLEAEVAEGLPRTVTIELKNVPARKALDAVCRVNHCRWELAVTAAGPTLRFTRVGS